MFKVYQVMPGESLEMIAEKVGTTTDYLMEINDFGGMNDLYSGSYIVIPNNKMNDNLFIWYTVQPGDSIYSIGQKNNIGFKDILAINGLDESDYIYPNQMIKIPNNNYNYYVTQQGDTLDIVGSRFNSNVEDIVRQNSTIYLVPDQFLVYKKEEKF